MKKAQKYVSWIIVCVGIVLRMREYIANRSLWVDEAYLANKIIGRSFLELLRPLSDSQHAPIGFLWAERGISYLFGSNEYVLRFVPLFAGIVSLIFFKKLAERVFPRYFAWIALAVFSFSDLLIRYSVELKQYSTEVCVALILYMLAISGVWNVTMLIVGLIAVVFSHTAILVLMAMSLVRCVLLVRQNKLQSLGVCIGWMAIWTSVFAVLYLRDVTQSYGNAFFVSEWPYVHLVPTSLRDVAENILGFQTMFRELLGGISSWIGLGLFILGMVPFFKKNKQSAFLLFAPFLLAILASGFEKYPYVTRVFLFVTPMLVLFMVEGVRSMKFKAVQLFLAALLIGSSLVQAAAYTGEPRAIEDVKPLFSYYRSHREKDDFLYVYYASEAAFRYYAPRYVLSDTPFRIGKESRSNWLAYIVDINHMPKKHRLWFLFSHVIITRIEGDKTMNEEEYIVAYLNKIGKQETVLKRTGASLYLYEFE